MAVRDRYQSVDIRQTYLGDLDFLYFLSGLSISSSLLLSLMYVKYLHIMKILLD